MPSGIRQSALRVPVTRYDPVVQSPGSRVMANACRRRGPARSRRETDWWRTDWEASRGRRLRPTRIPGKQRMSDPLIVVESLYKVFGPRPKQALELLEQGLSKSEIFEKTGMTVGVQDASFEIDEGEIFVIMGLSGLGQVDAAPPAQPTDRADVGQGADRGARRNAAWALGELIEVRRRKMAMVFQSFALLPHLSVWENAAFGLEVAGVARDGTTQARAGGARTGRARGIRRQLSGRALGRHAAACRAWRARWPPIPACS